jgi:hypothetical protein
MRIHSACRGLLAAAGLLTLVASGCAVSEHLDLFDASGAGGTGSTGTGSGEPLRGAAETWGRGVGR